MATERTLDAAAIIERERWFTALDARAKRMDIRIRVTTGGDSALTRYEPIDLATGRPILGSHTAAATPRSLAELEAFLANCEAAAS